MLDTIWSETRRLLHDAIPVRDFEAWIQPLRPARWAPGELTLEVPSVFSRDWLRRHFLADLERAVTAASGREAAVTLVVNRSLDLPCGARPEPPRRPGPVPVPLNGRYTFDNFVVGASNHVAYGAARAVVAQPGTRFNPLFVYGGCGLGKTHLLNAIAHSCAVERRDGAVACLSAENFVNEMIAAIQGHHMERFRRRFRGIQTLVMDDVQFLTDKRRSQEEFYHTFNALHDGRKQIVVASDRPPHELLGIEETLRSRFASGLLAHVEAPDPALRLALVRSKAGALGLTLEPEIAAYLAGEWCASVRQLEGAVVRLELFASLTGRALDLATVREALGPPPGRSDRQTSVERVIDEVCNEFKVTRDELLSQRREARVALPRQIAMLLCREQTDAPLRQIGRDLGGRDHSTVAHNLSAIERKLQRDGALRRLLATIRARLQA